MIVGKGLVATALEKFNNETVCYFCSGVSDSKTQDFAQFEREELLLRSNLLSSADKTFVYISTYSINDPDLQSTAYIKHKLKMEDIIQNLSPKYLIVRTSNLFGTGGNSKTILPFLIDNILNQKEFSAWQYANRNILDVDDLAMMIDLLIKEKSDRKEIVNLLGPESYTIKELVVIIEEYFGMNSKAIFIDKGIRFDYDLKEVIRLNQKYKIFAIRYLDNVLKKYYPKTRA